LAGGFLDSHDAGLRERNLPVVADFAGGELDDLAMARDGGYFSCGAIYVNRMVASLAQKLASMTFEMPD
jgi:hypothetical protein